MDKLNVGIKNFNRELIVAIKNKNLQQAQDAIENGAKAKGYEVLLVEALINGDIEIVKFLIKSGADVNFDSGSPLRYAASYGMNELIELILMHGGDVQNYKDAALRNAVSYNQVDTLKLLIDHGANIFSFENFAMKKSANSGFVDVIDVLLNAGANPLYIHEYGNKLSKKWLEVRSLSRKLENRSSIIENKKKL